MLIPGLSLDLQQLAPQRIAGPLPILRGELDVDDWGTAALAVAESGGRLVTLWGTDRRDNAAGGFAVSAVYATEDGLLWLDLALPERSALYPDLAGIFPVAARLQRALADLLGLRADGAADVRPWLNHGAWPADHFPLDRYAGNADRFPALAAGDYPFVPVRGEGVHEIAVGPVHAGIIEPGHFRFSVVGEKVLRLEERLGYKHKGVDQRFTEFPPREAHRLAGRISGDSTVAYAWAYCMALESAWAVRIPERAAWLRALLLERERVANHLGDLGALGNDAAFAFGLAQFSRLKEDWLRLNKALFGHRYLMDRIVPGGVAMNMTAEDAGQLSAQCDSIETEVHILQAIYDEHAGLQDRFITTGRVTPALAVKLGLCGLGGRASAQAYDLRADFSMSPYDRLGINKAVRRNGDVAARVLVRFDEVFESLRLIRAIASQLPTGDCRVESAACAGQNFGAGWIEGWRGPVFVAVEFDGERIRRCHCHDPSWQNWPVLEHAVIGNIVPDFPLINKSFNLSYAGHDR